MILTSDDLEVGKDIICQELRDAIRNYPGPADDLLGDIRMYIGGAEDHATDEDDRVALYYIWRMCVVGLSYLATNGVVTEDPRWDREKLKLSESIASVLSSKKTKWEDRDD